MNPYESFCNLIPSYINKNSNSKQIKFVIIKKKIKKKIIECFKKLFLCLSDDILTDLI